MTRTIVFVCHAELVSGAEIVMFRVVRQALAEQWDVVVAGPGDELARQVPDGARFIRLPPLGLHGEAGRARLLAALRLPIRWAAAARALGPTVRGEGTITVVNSLFALPAVRLARPRRGPVWVVHDVITQRRQRLTVRLGCVGRRGGRGLRAVAVSSAVAERVSALGIPVTVKVNGVDWPVEPATERRGGAPAIGIMGVLTPWKGHDELLEAVALLPAVTVEIAGGAEPGDQSFVERLRARALRPDLRGRVRFLGRVDSIPTMRGWDVLVSASVRPEATPLVVLEAMSVGVPVVGTDMGGTREILRGRVGLLVPPGDAAAMAAAIERALTDRDFRQRARAQGMRRVADEHNRHVTVPALFAELIR